MLLVLPVHDLLIKAMVKTKPFSVQLGGWKGLNIIAIGPQGGKIVGYGAGGKPVYAGSQQAQLLASIHSLQHKKEEHHVKEWLDALKLAHVVYQDEVVMAESAGEAIGDSFGVHGHKDHNGLYRFKIKSLLPHAGQPLKPKAEEGMHWAAGIAAGDDDHDPFPDLKTLKAQPAGKYAGSHGNQLFTDSSGRKWIFKHADPTIARAEEAANRIGRLLLGNKAFPPAKYVQVGGEDGVLVGEMPGDVVQEGHHGSSDQWLIQNFDKLVQHQVVDWLVSNHDSHAGNFLTNDDGSLVGIDKGQAWKFFGKDKLHPEYKPNPSAPVYNRMWALYEQGKIKVDPVVAAQKVIAAAAKMTPEQFKLIVAPYVATLAGHTGMDPQKRADAMAKRLIELPLEWGSFLAERTGKPVQWKTPGKDNFETMPDEPAKQPAPKKKKAPALTIKNPAELASAPAEQPAPVVEAPLPGWPSKKGKITVHHPGEQHDGGIGPGFIASMVYKGKDYKLEVVTEQELFESLIGKGNPTEPMFKVTYPNGAQHLWNSANKASDSMYLFEKGLPLAMSSTEKKAKGISYPANKAFGLKAFESELQSAWGQKEKTPAAMSPVELETKKIIEPAAKSVSTVQLLSKMPAQMMPDWGSLPIAAQEVAKAFKTYPMGSEYIGAPPPGTVILAHKNGLPHLFVTTTDQYGAAKYVVFLPDGKSGWTTTAMSPATAEQKYDINMVPGVEATYVQKIMEAPPVVNAGAPPEVELPKGAEVPADAPKHHAGPLAPGTKIKKGNLTLEYHGEGGGMDGTSYSVTHETAEGNELTKYFPSISAASKYAFHVSKGFKTAEDYKAAMGKPLPGVNWPFWGIKPKKADDALGIGVKTAPVAPPQAPENLKPTANNIKQMAPGTVLTWDVLDDAGGIYAKTTAKKTNDGLWSIKYAYADGDKEVHLSKEDALIVGLISGDKIVNVDEVQTNEPTKPLAVEKVSTAESESNWEWFDDATGGAVKPIADHLVDLPIGTAMKVHISDGLEQVINKVGDNAWENEQGSIFTNKAVAAWASDSATGGIQLQKPTKPVAPKESALPKTASSELASASWHHILMTAPNGTKINLGGDPDFYLLKDQYGVWNVKTKQGTAVEPIPAHAAMMYLKNGPVDMEHTIELTGNAPKTVKPKAPKAKLMTVGPAISQSEMAEGKVLGEMPIGTVFKFSGSDTAYAKKLDDDQWHVTIGTSKPLTLNAAGIYKLASKGNASSQHIVVPPEGYAFSTTKKTKLSAEDQAKIEKAKAVGAWLKDKPPVTSAESLHILAHFQYEVAALYDLPGKIWVRTDPKGVLVMGSASPTFQKMMKDVKLDSDPVTTPLGTFYEVTTAQLAHAIPGDLWKTITGPDGNTYPAGTKFKEKKTEYTVEQLLKDEPGFTKFSEHKIDPEQMMIKITGTGETQHAQMQAIISKYGLPGPVIPGASYTITPVTKAKLASVGKTETTLEAKPHKQPEPFVFAGFPSAGSLAVGAAMANDPVSEVALLTTKKLPRFGHPILMGKAGILRDFQVHVRKVRQEDGKIVYEVQGQLCHFAPENSSLEITAKIKLRSAMGGPTGSLNYDENSGLHIESDDIITSCSGHSGTTEGGSTIEVIESTPTFKDVFKVRIQEGADLQAELKAAFTKMGYDPDAALSPADETTFKKFSVVRSMMGPKGWQKGLQDGAGAHDEKWLNKQIKKYGVQQLVDTAQIRQTFEGHASVVADDGDKFKDAGWKFAYRHDKDLDSLFHQIADGVGWASRKHKYLMGSSTSGWSSSPDIHSGGATGNFFRVGMTASVPGGSGDYVVAHPRVFARTDWWRYNGDNYGNIAGPAGSYGSINSGQERYETEVQPHGNEIMFEGGLPVSDMMCVVVHSEQSKKMLLTKLAGAGVTEVNGIPTKDFILVGGHNLIDRVHPSLKEGT